MQIIELNKNYVIVKKEYGIPTQSDKSGDKDLLTMTGEYLKSCGEDGRLWLIHRLDRVVSGLVVFARNARYAALLSSFVSSKSMNKEYLAVVRGRTEEGTLTDLIYKDARAGKSFVVDRMRAGVKEARLSYKTLSYNEERDISLVRVRLDTGRFHQIRCQMSHIGHPILGDGKYGGGDNSVHGIALVAFHLSISEPECKFNAYSLPNTIDYPWCLFDKVNFEEYRND